MKIRLNKLNLSYKTEEELSTNQVLGTLQTKQKQIKEDITTYIDEPFLKPENIRHGITIAGVDGNYLHEVKYLNIYDIEGNHLRTLASTEANPEIKNENGNIILTNKPFENQCAYGVSGDTAFVRWSDDKTIDPLTANSYLLFAKATKAADLVIDTSNYVIQDMTTSYNGSVLAYDFYNITPEMGDYVVSDHKEISFDPDRIHDRFYYSYNGPSAETRCFVEYIHTGHVGYYQNSTTLDGIKATGVNVTTDKTFVSGQSLPYATITFPETFDLTDPLTTVYVTVSDGSVHNNPDHVSYVVCQKQGNVSGGADLTLGQSIYDLEASKAAGRLTTGNIVKNKNTLSFIVADPSFSIVEIEIHAIQLIDRLPQEEAFKNVPESTDINIPYYVELPTKAYELGFDEDVAIGETSKMLIQRNSNRMEYNHYLMNLESAAPGIYKRSNSIGGQDITVYETLSQRIIVQYLSYRYNADDISQVHEELRVIEDSRTGEFNKRAFSNNGYGHIQEYSHMPDDPVTFIMLSDNANSPSSQYATGDTRRWGGTMGFVFKLRDGKFFIIDGGIGGNNPAHTKYDSQAPILAAALKQYASDPNNIKIAGWLLTHAHQDHVGVFCEFIEKPEYKSIISIDKVIYSLPVEGFQCFKKTSSIQTYKEFDEALNVLRAEGKTEIVKAHMGMKFNLGGLGLTILSAPENVYRSYDPDTGELISDFDNINDTCVLSKVEYAGKRLIFMADACDIQIGAAVMPLIANVIGEATALQVPHHGYADTKSSRLYTQIGQLTLESNLEFTIWPLCYEHFSGKQVNGEDYYEGGKKYNSVFAHSNNAALQNIQAIYPENNYSMVATSNTIGEWTFTAVDFVDPCSHGTSFEYRYSTLGNNKHLCECYCSDCMSYVYSYEEECIYLDDGTCNYCRASKPACEHTYDYRQISDGAHEKYCTRCGYVAESYISCTKGANDTCEFCNNDFCHYCTNTMGLYTCSQCGNNYCDEHGSGGYCKNCSGGGESWEHCNIAGCSNPVYSNCNYCQSYFCKEHFYDPYDYKCIECYNNEDPNAGKTPFTCAHCGGTHYYEDGYSHCYECGDIYGDSCSASCPNAEPECSHSSSSYSYYQDSDSSHRIYCNECSKDIATGVSCTVNAHGYCEFCNNDFCIECGFFSPDTTCYVCGSPICSNCAAYISGNSVCPDCAGSKYRVTFTQANGNYTSWINNNGVATDTMPYYTVGSNGSVSTVFMLDMYGPTSIKAYVTEGAANVTVTRVAGHSEQFTVTVSNVLGHTNVIIEAV